MLYGLDYLLPCYRYYLELLIEIGKHSLQYREPSEFVEIAPYEVMVCRVF